MIQALCLKIGLSLFLRDRNLVACIAAFLFLYYEVISYFDALNKNLGQINHHPPLSK